MSEEDRERVERLEAETSRVLQRITLASEKMDRLEKELESLRYDYSHLQKTLLTHRGYFRSRIGQIVREDNIPIGVDEQTEEWLDGQRSEDTQ